MKPGCLLILAAVPFVLLGAGYSAWWYADTLYGIHPADPRTHDELVEDDTRVKVVINSERLVKYVLTLLPPNAAERLPFWLPWSVEDVVKEVLPPEVALIAGTDYATHEMRFTLFVNERRGGPVIADYLNRFGRFHELQGIAWDEPVVRAPERGMVTASGVLGLPGDTEQRLVEHWRPKHGRSKARVSRENLIEAVVDNSDGEGMTLVAALGMANDWNLEEIFADPAFESVLIHIETARLTANLTGRDEITIELRLEASHDADLNARLLMLGGVTTVLEDLLRPRLKRDFGLVIDYASAKDKPDWYDGKVMVGKFKLSGFRNLLAARVDELWPGGAPAQ